MLRLPRRRIAVASTITFAFFVLVILSDFPSLATNRLHLFVKPEQRQDQSDLSQATSMYVTFMSPLLHVHVRIHETSDLNSC